MGKVVHFRPGAAYSYPIPSKGPRIRCFLVHSVFSVCNVGRARFECESSDRPSDVTCKRCLRIMAIGRFDEPWQVAEVLARGASDG